MKIAGMMVCGPHEPHLDKVLAQFKRLKLEPVIIVGNHIDEKSSDLIKSYGYELVIDDREWGKHQPHIKSDLLRRFLSHSPDWIVACDADELFDDIVTRETLEELATRGGLAWNFYVVNYWNDDEHYATGLSFWNVRFFKFTPEYGLEFINKPVHCGLAPPMQYRYANDSGYILWHYGLMDKEKRKRKVERYNKYDPNAAYKSDLYYKALADETPPASLDREVLRKRVLEDVMNRKMKAVPQVFTEPEGYVYLQKGNRVIDVEKKDQRRYERQGWKFVEDINLEPVAPTKVEPPVTEEKTETKEVECALCGSKFPNQKELIAHKRSHT